MSIVGKLLLKPVAGRLARRWYPPRGLFEDAIRRRVSDDISSVLVFGAGRGAKEVDWRRHGVRIVGVDVDPVVFENPYLTEAHTYSGGALPFDDEVFDVCYSRMVIEHLEQPERVFAEVHRVLRPGGHFVFLTPNLFCYPYLVSKALPNRLHPWLVRATTGREELDTFPTWYRANTRKRLRELLSGAGFSEDRLTVHLTGVPYLGFSLPTFLLGAVYERIVNSTKVFEDLRQVIIGDFVRQRTAGNA
jgi:SAM-dependent methyltransferase